MELLKTTPLLLPTAALSAGILVAHNFCASSLWGIPLLVAISILLYTSKRLKDPILKTIIYSLFFFGGALLWSLQNEQITSITNALQSTNELECKSVSYSYLYKNRLKYKFELQLLNPSLQGYKLNFYSAWNPLRYNNHFFLKNIKLKSPNLFDLKSGIIGTAFYNPKENQISFLPKVSLTTLEKIEKQKRIFNYRLLKKMDILSSSFFGLIFFGNKQKEVVVPLREAFDAWGIAHYLARSGLHLNIFSLILALFFLLIPIGIRYRYVLSLAFSLIYFFLTFSSISIVRAQIMLVLFILAKIFHRQENLLHFLSLTAFLILVFNPYQLFALDFQLTFSLVLGLGLASSL